MYIKSLNAQRQSEVCVKYDRNSQTAIYSVFDT